MEYTFVVDLYSGAGANGMHYGTLVVEQAPIQAYWIHALHVHMHGQLNAMELEHHLRIIEHKSFEKLTMEDIQCSRKRPDKYYMVLTKEHDWDIDEILVFNNFHKHPVLMRLVHEINLSGFAHRVLVDEWETTKKWVNKRGNFQLNHGSNHIDMNDSTSIPGVNIARDHARVKTIKPGMYNHNNLEETIIYMQTLVTSVFDYIASISQRERVFIEVVRRGPFSSRKMKAMGLPEDAFRGDAGAFLYSGLFMTIVNGWYSAQCSMHRDLNNDHRSCGGADANVCLSQLICMNYPNTSDTVVGRAALNQFNKECNGRVIEKVTLTEMLVVLVKRCMSSLGVMSDYGRIDWPEVHNRVEKHKRPGEDFAVISAHANKDTYYSWFVHEILSEVVPIYGLNQHLMIEIAYTMSLTPSSPGWRKGVRYALMAMNNGLNFYNNFVREMVCKDDAVSNHYGHRGRHQVTSGALITNHQAQVSMFNYHVLCKRACEPDCDSKDLYNDMSKGVDNGGLRNVKHLTAFDLVNVSTKIGSITNRTHCRNITIAKNTETAKRLAAFGIRTDAHRRELMVKLAQELGLCDYQIVENMICETLRWHAGDERDRFMGVDTVGIDQPLYSFVHEELLRIGSNGVVSSIDLNTLKTQKATKIYAPKYRWWELDHKSLATVLGDDFNIYLTKNSKCLKAHYATLRRSQER